MTIKQRHGTADLAPEGKEEGKVEVVGDDVGTDVFGGEEGVREEKEAVSGIRRGTGHDEEKRVPQLFGWREVLNKKSPLLNSLLLT